MIFGLNGVNTHQRGFMRFGAICPNWQASSDIGAKSSRLYYGHPQLAGKRLVRATQCTQFCAKSAKNDLNPTDFLKRNFHFETERVLGEISKSKAAKQVPPAGWLCMYVWMYVAGSPRFNSTNHSGVEIKVCQIFQSQEEYHRVKERKEGI